MSSSSPNSINPDPLTRVCSLLNKHGARYMVVGGHACILHGLVRTMSAVKGWATLSRESGVETTIR